MMPPPFGGGVGALAAMGEGREGAERAIQAILPPGLHMRPEINPQLLLLSLMGRDFTDTDFERLSELDGDVPNRHGASDKQVASLERKRWSRGAADEPCSICLEPLEDGDEYVPLACG